MARGEYGRIRLYQDSAAMLHRVLLSERDLLCLARRNRPLGEKTLEYNQRIARLDEILDELNRMRAEKGWDERDTQGGSARQAASG